MKNKWFTCFAVVSLLFFLQSGGSKTAAQDDPTHLRVNVVLVQLNVAVTDEKGNYVTGLRPENFEISEDGVRQKIATFGEGDSPARKVEDLASNNPAAKDPPANLPADSSSDLPSNGTLGSLNSTLAGSNVFVLFDTSNYMYRGFVFAQDAIADFVRSLENVNRVSFYSYSRDLTRDASLTANRSDIQRAVRTVTAIPPRTAARKPLSVPLDAAIR